MYARKIGEGLRVLRRHLKFSTHCRERRKAEVARVINCQTMFQCKVQQLFIDGSFDYSNRQYLQLGPKKERLRAAQPSSGYPFTETVRNLEPLDPMQVPAVPEAQSRPSSIRSLMDRPAGQHILRSLTGKPLRTEHRTLQRISGNSPPLASVAFREASRLTLAKAMRLPVWPLKSQIFSPITA